MTASVDVDGPDTGAGTGPRGRRRMLTGVLPVTGAVVVVAAAVLIFSPAARHTLGVSFARQDEHYVELFFTDEKTARTCPVTTAGDVAVRASLTSHLDGRQPVAWTIRLRPDSGTTQQAHQATGTLDSRPGRTTRFGTELPSPSGPYTVVVTLGSRSERLVLNC